ncbi:hypothetical protein K435DRAFT_876209 [Dendrothele bispora CBS 962.96]|uniref:DUF6535 domain-containing protein n=1 Tax=Dendrothele bispora (strain CBS 962.96) TaxID=1314807 RepID=A0A4S8KSY1_DENBC|nr:hypothetical protein K435DRAFT_876209 [Dendrothele bispora CBS 962.96]
MTRTELDETPNKVVVIHDSHSRKDNESSTSNDGCTSTRQEPEHVSEVLDSPRETHRSTKNIPEKRTKKPLFGSRSQPQGDRYDYANIYADDAPYQELNPNARVWKVYNDEADKLDLDTVEDWRDGLDALLVFGALFSAVVTTIVVETSQRLDFDWGEVSANLLAESVALQRAAINGTPTTEIPSSSLTPSSSFSARTLDVVLNLLWFISLVLSLGTALSAVVAKQWIHQYMAIPSGNPQERARLRHFRHMGLDKWHMAAIIGLLPMFVHLSLIIFFAGLVIFLHDLNLIIAVVIDILVSTTLSTYFVGNLLPVWYIDCPYKTPLTTLLFPVITKLRKLLGSELSRFGPSKGILAFSGIELAFVRDHQGHKIDAHALSWLITSSTSSSAKDIALDALSSLIPSDIRDILPSIFDLENTIEKRMYEAESQQRLETYGRAARTLLHLLTTDPFSRPLSSPLPSQFNSELLAPHHYDDSSSHKHFIEANLQGNITVQHEALLWAHWAWFAGLGMSLSSMDREYVNVLLMFAVTHLPVESTHVLIAICDDHDSIFPGWSYRPELPLHYCRRRIEGSRVQVQGDNIELERLSTCLTRPCTFSWFLENMVSLHLYELLIKVIKGYEDYYATRYDDTTTPIHLQLLRVTVNVPETWTESPDIVEKAILKMKEYVDSWSHSSLLTPIINVEAEAALIAQSLTQRLNSWSSLANEHFFVRQDERKEKVNVTGAPYPLVPKPGHIIHALSMAVVQLDVELVRSTISADMAAGIVRRCFGILQYRFELDPEHEKDAYWAYHRVKKLLKHLLYCSTQSIEWRNTLWTAFLDADFLLVDIWAPHGAPTYIYRGGSPAPGIAILQGLEPSEVLY